MAAQNKPRESDAWIPTKPGEKLSGKVTEVSVGNGEYGSYPLLSVEGDDGQTWKLHGFRTVLKNLILEKQPMVGEHVTVTYDGPRAKRESDGTNNPPVLYSLTIDSRDAMREARRMYAKLEGREPDAADSLAAEHASTEPF